MKFFKQIKKNELFFNFTDKEIELFFDSVDARVEKKNPKEIIFRPNEEITEICIILEGNLVEFIIRPNGAKDVLSSKVDGDMFGLPFCFCATNRINSYITSATESCLLYIENKAILNLKESDCPVQPKLYANLVKSLSESMYRLQCNKDFISIKGMRKKIAKFIYDKYVAQCSKIVQLGVDRNGMAKYLNVSRPSMSREMINMREEGVFDFRKDIVTIKDPEALREIAYGE